MLATRRGLNVRKMRQQLDAARRDGTPDRFWGNFREGLEQEQIKPEDFRLGSLFEEFVPDGRELRRLFDPANAGSFGSETLLESAVETGDFANITGQIVYTKVLDRFESPQFIGPRLTENVPTQFDGEKIPGIGLPGSNVETVGEGTPYPLAGINEEWIQTPPTAKRGMIIPVTKEAIFFDRTGILLSRAGNVAESLAIKKERNILAAVLGTTNTYNRNGGGTQATYGDTHTQGDFDNLSASTALVDWTDIEACLLLFDAMVDPNTGDPIMVTPSQIVVPSALSQTASQILNATNINRGIPGSTSFVTLADTPNTTPGMELVTGPWVKDTTSSTSTWFIGDFPKGFAYMENWPITVTKADQDSSLGFSHDIVTQFKASERGVAVAIDPRYAVKATG